MGRHEAADGEAVHPVVAEALARRAADTVGTHHERTVDGWATQRIEGEVGWPGEPPARDGGLGWPGDLAQDAADDDGGTDLSADAEEELPEHPGAPSLEPAVRRRGWRRLLGLAA